MFVWIPPLLCWATSISTWVDPEVGGQGVWIPSGKSEVVIGVRRNTGTGHLEMQLDPSRDAIGPFSRCIWTLLEISKKIRMALCEIRWWLKQVARTAPPPLHPDGKMFKSAKTTFMLVNVTIKCPSSFTIQINVLMNLSRTVQSHTRTPQWPLVQTLIYKE